MSFTEQTIMPTEILTIEENGKFTLPDEIVERYQFKRETQFRIIETQKGVLLIPLTDEPMSDELKTELEEWQAIGADSWEMFDFEENVL
jgi:bifunctional DNA-binding transcriptional regulator/antitoxin component of YhaV-PrlF toxin-antitoxin module